MADATSIHVDAVVDPSTLRIKGVAHQGMTPFDVPYISRVEGAENLWQGGCKNGLRLPHQIRYVVSLYPWEEYRPHEYVAGIVRHELYDAALTADPVELEALADVVNAFRRLGPTLVHCQAGLNRSALIVGLALIRAGVPPVEAIQSLRDSRSPAVLCNKEFEQWLLSR